MRNSTNIFLTNLSIADLLVLLVCTPTVLVEVNSKPETWVLGQEMCKFAWSLYFCFSVQEELNDVECLIVEYPWFVNGDGLREELHRNRRRYHDRE